MSRKSLPLSLSQRLALVFGLLLLTCCGLSAWLQMRANALHGQEVIQGLSSGLAAHIAESAPLMQDGAPNDDAVRQLFDKLMDVNPSVEVYLLDLDGRIVAQAAPAGHLKRQRVDVEPLRRVLKGEPLPILGDDPRSEAGRKVFSVAPLRGAGRMTGYLYVVLLGEDHDALAERVMRGGLLRTSLWTAAVVMALGLLAGLAAFHWVTRPLRRLTDEVERFQADGRVAPVMSASHPAGDEIATLHATFEQMRQRIAEQWQELSEQDQRRRELIANISHDLRTPLTSLHGYLETLRVKSNELSEADRARYLDIALGQSRKVGRLAQALFELARLECGVVKPEKEQFSLADLVQDVFQKFELAAEARGQRLLPHIPLDLPVVHADVGMIERVLTNLLDNAVRHTPHGGTIEVRLQRDGDRVAVVVSDSGPGIPPELRPHLFHRPLFRSGAHPSAGGLGLLIVQGMLQLHGSSIALLAQQGPGAAFQFTLEAQPG